MLTSDNLVSTQCLLQPSDIPDWGSQHATTQWQGRIGETGERGGEDGCGVGAGPSVLAQDL